MKKFFKIISLALSFVLLITLVSCNNDIKGSLEITTTSTKIEATASFNKNTILEESTTIVTIKLYNEDVSEQLERKTVNLGDEKVQGSVTFEDLTSDTTYVLRLYVSHNGTETFICEANAITSSSGSSEEKPIEINSIADFYLIEEDRDAYYKLMCDLDFIDAADISICSSSEPFEGVFDGNGHTISNYKIATGEYAGLFEYAKDATFKNLNLSNVYMSSSSTCKNIGALVGYATNTIISDVCLNNFDLITPSSSSTPTTTSQIGGLVGVITTEADSNDDKNISEIKNSKALNINFSLTQIRPSSNYLFYCGAFAGRISGETSVDNCKAEGVLDIKTKSSNGTAYIGGFAGAIESSLVVSNSISMTSISLVRNSNTFSLLCIGGFAGSNAAGQINLDNCFAVGDIEALNDEARNSNTTNIAMKAFIGGVVGLITSSPKGVKNCYYAKACNGISVVQADIEQSTNYVDKCFVSTTIAYVSNAIKNKISDVYSYDDCLNVKGMTIEGADTLYIESANNSAYENIFNQDIKDLFELFINSRESFILEMSKFDYESYSYTYEILEDTSIELSNNVSIVILGTSSVLSVESSTIIVKPVGSQAFNSIKISMLFDDFTINAIVHMVTK